MNPESMLKGRMAETLTEELLRQSGNAVYRFGYEAIVQNLAQLANSFDRYSEVGERIRAIPDFIIVDKNGKPDFVEVKFRWKPEVQYEKDYERFEKIGLTLDEASELVALNQLASNHISMSPREEQRRKDILQKLEELKKSEK